MSIRTIIEINHDRLHELEDMTIGQVMQAIDKAQRNRSNMATLHGLNCNNGVTRLTSHHHSTDVAITLNGFVTYSNRVE